MDDELSMYLSRAGLTFPGLETAFDSSEYVFFGVPFDSSSSAFPGSRYGPKAIREVIQGMELWSEYFGVDLEDMRVYDAGDLAVSHGDAVATASVLKRAVQRIVSLGKMPVMIGGEHTFTPFAALAAGADSLIVLDAHADCRKDYLGNPLSHACATRIWVDSGGKHTFQIGIRATSREERDYCKEKGIIQFSPFQLQSDSFMKSLADFVGESRSLYLSIDMDAFDPSYAPGVGTPEPFGISPIDALRVFEAISGANLVGFDVMELCPLRDPSYSSSALAAKLIMELYASRKARHATRSRARKGGVVYKSSDGFSSRNAGYPRRPVGQLNENPSTAARAFELGYEKPRCLPILGRQDVAALYALINWVLRFRHKINQKPLLRLSCNYTGLEQQYGRGFQDNRCLRRNRNLGRPSQGAAEDRSTC